MANSEENLDDPRLPVTSGFWTTVEGRACILCGQNAVQHPRLSYVWGCNECRYSTEELETFFFEVSEG